MQRIVNVIVSFYMLLFLSGAQCMELSNLDKAYQLHFRASLLPDSDPRKMPALYRASQLGSASAEFDLAMLGIKNAANQGCSPAQEMLAKVGEINNDPEAAFIWHHTAHVPRKVKSVGFDLEKRTFYTKENNFIYTEKPSGQRKKVEKEQNAVIDEEGDQQLSSECNTDKLAKRQLKKSAFQKGYSSQQNQYPPVHSPRQSRSLAERRPVAPQNTPQYLILKRGQENIDPKIDQEREEQLDRLANEPQITKLQKLKEKADKDNNEAQYLLAQFYLKHKRQIPAIKDYVATDKEACDYLGHAVDGGHQDALVTLGVRYLKGDCVEKDYGKARDCFERAGNDNALAQYNLGLMYLQDQGIARDNDKALDHFYAAFKNAQHDNAYHDDYVKDRSLQGVKACADQGNVRACYDLGMTLYNDGHKNNYDESYKDARTYLQKAADGGHADACCHLAHMHLRGYGGKTSMFNGLKCFEKAEEQTQNSFASLSLFNQLCDDTTINILTSHAQENNDMHARYILARLWYARKSNFEDAYTYFKQIADQHDALAQCYVGDMLLQGQGVKQSVDDAIRYFHRAAKFKSVTESSINQRARMYALKSLARLSDEGNIHASYYLIHTTLSNKQTDKQSIKEMLLRAEHIENQAYDNNDEKTLKALITTGAYSAIKECADNNNPDACRLLGFIHVSRGSKQRELILENNDPKEEINVGINYLKRALEYGDPDGQGAKHLIASGEFSLGCLYQKERSTDTACEHFEQAASQGHVVAKSELGMMLYREAAKDPEKGKKGFALLKEAAEAGDAVAQDIVGNIYYAGNVDLAVEINYELAYRYLKQVYKQGIKNPTTCSILGHLLYEHGGEGSIPNDPQQAQELLQIAADAGDDDAMYCLGTMHYNKKEYDQAHAYFIKTMEHNNLSRWHLGMMCLNGLGIERNVTRACAHFIAAQNNQGDTFRHLYALTDDDTFNTLKKLAEHKDLRACYFFGRLCYSSGDERASHNRQQAFDALLYAANHGYALAQYYVGEMYYLGNGVEKSADKAVEYSIKVLNNSDKLANSSALSLLRHLAHREDNLAARHYLIPYLIQQRKQETIDEALLLFLYINSKINSSSSVVEEVDALITSDAFKMVKELADNGHNDASYHVGVIYYKRGTMHKEGFADFKESIKYLERAGGKKETKAALKIAYDHYAGLCTKANKLKEAIAYCEQAISLGSVAAKTWLGDAYLQGLMPKTSPAKALKKGIKLLQEAAEGNDPDAQCILGNLYLRGPIKELGCGARFKHQNTQKAESYLRAAANQEHSIALRLLGATALKKKNPDAAEQFIGHAADQNDPDALYELGLVQSSQKKHSQAVESYKKSAEQGNVLAKCALGIAYLSGNGVEQQDYTSAVRYFIDAINHGALVDGEYANPRTDENFDWAIKALIVYAQQDNKAKTLLKLLLRCLEQKGKKYDITIE